MPILDKLLECKRNWIQHVNRMPRKKITQGNETLFRNWQKELWQPLKRLLDTWDRIGSTSGPTAWQIYDDDENTSMSLRYKMSCLICDVVFMLQNISQSTTSISTMFCVHMYPFVFAVACSCMHPYLLSLQYQVKHQIASQTLLPQTWGGRTKPLGLHLLTQGLQAWFHQ